MIKVTKDYNTVPEALTRVGCYEKIQRSIINQSGAFYNGNHYRAEKVVEKLNVIYNKKCAYCESKSSHVAALQVEHYRSKNAGKYLAERNHKGYYWLGGEWSNLLLACPKCNGYKGTKFPIIGIRLFHGTMFKNFNKINTFNRKGCIANQTPLIHELPLLLNPEIDEPQKHLTFNSNGLFETKSLKGTATISILELNRGDLWVKRKTIRNEILKNFEEVILGIIKGIFLENDKIYLFLLKTAFNKIKKRTQPTEEYTLWGRYFYNNFEACFVEKLHPAYQNGIRKAFEAYKNKQLNSTIHL